MLRKSLLSVRHNLITRKLKRTFFKWSVLEDVIGPTYLLIPEDPIPDETNPIFDPHRQARFKSLAPDEIFRAASKLTMDFEAKLDELSDEIASGEAPINFEYIMDRTEGFTYPVDSILNWCRLVYFLHDNPINQLIYTSVSTKVSVTKMERWTSSPLKKAVDSISANEGKQLTEFDRGLLHIFQRQFRLHGTDLKAKKNDRVLKTAALLLQLERSFRICTSATTKKFVQTVNARSLSEAPAGFVERLMLQSGVPGSAASGGICQISLADDVYQTFMTYCSDRALRRNAWDAWVRRAGQSLHSAERLSNQNTIAEIRKNRRLIAQELGFRNHAELKLSGYMAGRVEPVVEMLDLYRLKYWERAEDEMQRLLDFAAKDGMPIRGPFQPWDLAYWSRKYDRAHATIDWNSVRQYFPFERVLAKSFELFRLWFGVEIVEAPSSEADLPHSDVRHYHVKDLEQRGNVIASFYLDPFKRPGRVGIANMLPIVDRSEAFGRDPVAYFALNLNKNNENNVMDFNELGDFMHAFGNGMQHLLTRVDHPEVAGQNGIPPDAVNICGHVFRRLLQTPVVLRALSQHCDTGESMPEELLHLVANARSAVVALPLLEELYHAAFDLDMWISEEFWRDAQSRLWSEFMVMEEVAGDEWPCGATDIFCDGRDATLYSTVWSTTVAGDIVSAFEDIDIDLASTSTTPGDMRPVMERFRSTFLSLGGAVPAGEVFRRFRGRDPVRTVDIL